MILQILIDIEGIQFLGIKACQEHSHYKQQVEWFHFGLFLLHAQVDVIIVSAEVVCSESRSEHLVVIIHDGLKFISCHILIFKSLVHASLIVVLTVISCVCEYSTDLDFRIEQLEYLVIFQEHRHRLDGKKGVIFSVKRRFIEIVKDELSNFSHSLLVEQVNALLSLIVFYQKAKHIFISNGILNEIVVQTVAITSLVDLSCLAFSGNIGVPVNPKIWRLLKNLTMFLWQSPK